MKCLRLLLILLFASVCASAQGVPSNCIDNIMDVHDPNPPCNQTLLMNLKSGAFHAPPFLDTLPNGQNQWPRYGDGDGNIESLYGDYGNNESTSSSAAAVAHYTLGKTLAGQIKPLCTDGSTSNPCPDGNAQSIVFLFIGFSNTDIEIGGGNADVWDKTDDSLNEDPTNHFSGHLFGQPCSTLCENLNNPDGATPWNQVTIPSPSGDGYVQKSLLNQVYPDTNKSHWLVGPDVVLFNGALGQQTLAKWILPRLGTMRCGETAPLTIRIHPTRSATTLG
jgi:hypothetical protein